ncbi:hypothetical protein RHS01_07207 [Rhizoctonia solani]|uniref:Uncharacterized protein n=1 Tax=Rhizoctonia solani TaxID=456999 RepID=A0A8H7I7E8_9AGAM|nr:hypothetical protein RHS01_07207 [Rhizoctonia solani]
MQSPFVNPVDPAVQKNDPAPPPNNALGLFAPVVRSPAIAEGVDKSKMYEQHPIPESPYKVASLPKPRGPLLEAWRTRMGDVSAPTVTSTTCRGGLLPTRVLDLIAVMLLHDAPPKTRPRHTLKEFSLASRRFRSVAAPYIYEHGILAANGDAGVYARTGNSKYIRSLTIQFEPHDPWNPHGALMDQKLYPTQLHTADQIQETGLDHFFPNLTQISFVAKFSPDEARIKWLAGSHIFGPSFGSGNFEPTNRAKLYESPGFLAMKLLQLIPPKVKTVGLDADLSEVVTKFTIAFMTRAGDPADEVRLDLVTRRDQVVQEVEFAIHSHASSSADPTPARTTMVMYGPSYGTRVVWDGTNPEIHHRLSGVDSSNRRNNRKPNPPLNEEEMVAESQTGTTHASVKNSKQVPIGVDSEAQPEPGPELELESNSKREPGPLSEPLTFHSTKSAPGLRSTTQPYPPATSTLQRRPLQLQGEDADYPEFWRFVDNMSGNESRIGVWHTTARAEVETFMTAYREKRFGDNMEALKLQMLHDIRADGTVVEQELGPVDREKVERTMGPSVSTFALRSGSGSQSSKRARIE